MKKIYKNILILILLIFFVKHKLTKLFYEKIINTNSNNTNKKSC